MSFQFDNKVLAESLYDAFQAEPFYLAIAQARENQQASEKEVLLKYFDYSIQEAAKYGICYTLENQAIGASIWTKPQSKKWSLQQSIEKKEILEKHLGKDSLAIYKKMAALMGEKEAEIIGPNYWYLSILAVAKAFQGKGYGRKLLNPVLAKADQLGVPTFLETFTEGNLIFYGKLGYEVVLDYFEPHLQKTCWILVREAVVRRRPDIDFQSGD